MWPLYHYSTSFLSGFNIVYKSTVISVCMILSEFKSVYTKDYTARRKSAGSASLADPICSSGYSVNNYPFFIPDKYDQEGDQSIFKTSYKKIPEDSVAAKTFPSGYKSNVTPYIPVSTYREEERGNPNKNSFHKLERYMNSNDISYCDDIPNIPSFQTGYAHSTVIHHTPSHSAKQQISQYRHSFRSKKRDSPKENAEVTRSKYLKVERVPARRSKNTGYQLQCQQNTTVQPLKTRDTGQTVHQSSFRQTQPIGRRETLVAEAADQCAVTLKNSRQVRGELSQGFAWNNKQFNFGKTT